MRGEFEALSNLDATALPDYLAQENRRWIEQYGGDFPSLSHEHQLPPKRANSGANWLTWLILGGRGAGKTRAGAEWVRGIAINDKTARIALIGETEHDTREVMVEGVSGLLAVHMPAERPQWIPSRRRIEWSNGAVAEIFSAENHEGLRGPQFSAAWLDELAKWRHGLHTCPQQAWVSFHRTVAAFLKLPDHLMIYSGMAIGMADESAAINSWRSPREPLDAFASFDGFDA